MSYLQFQNVTKKYGSKIAADNVSISVNEGAFLTLLGPSGSGKTTLLTVLAGFTSVDGGRVLVDGRDLTDIPPERRGLGLVFQGYALFPHMSVFNNIAYPLRVRRMGKTAIRDRVMEMISLVDLGGMEHRKPKQLSGGQQQRVALARALAFRPPILLLDEPLSALDRRLREQLQREIKRLHRSVRTTFVFVTHDQDEALALSTDIAVLKDGKVEQFGTPDELYSRPRNSFVASFVGDNNLLVPEEVSGKAGAPTCKIAGQLVTVPADVQQYEKPLLSVRAENIRVSRTFKGDVNAIPVRIRDIDYHGDTYTMELVTENGTVLKSRIAAGDFDRRCAPSDEAYAIWRSQNSVWVEGH